MERIAGKLAAGLIAFLLLIAGPAALAAGKPEDVGPPGDSEEVQEPEADVSISKDADENSVEEGDQITYTLEVENGNNADTAEDVEVSDDLPSGVILDSVDTSVGSCPTQSDSQVDCDLGDVDEGDSATIEIVVTTDEDEDFDDEELENTASVSTSTTDKHDNDDEDTADVTVEDTTVAEVDPLPSPSPGPSNNGNNGDNGNNGETGNTGDVKVVDADDPDTDFGNDPKVPCVPFRLRFSGFTAGSDIEWTVVTHGQTTPTGEELAGDTDAMPANGDDGLSGVIDLREILLTDYVANESQGYQVHLEAAEQPDGNAKQKSFFIKCDPGTLTIAKEVEGDSDEGFEFTLDGDDIGAPLGDGDSAELTVSGGEHTVAEIVPETGWETPTVECGGDVINGSSIEVTVLTDDVTCTFTNTAESGGGEIIVVPSSDLRIDKSDDADPVNEGDNLTYTITVDNDGDAPVMAVVTDLLPEGVTFVSASVGEEDACDTSLDELTGRTLLTCNLGSILEGTVEITLVVNVSEDADGEDETITNTAIVEGVELDLQSAARVSVMGGISAQIQDPTPNNNSDTETTQVLDNDGSSSSSSSSRRGNTDVDVDEGEALPALPAPVDPVPTEEPPPAELPAQVVDLPAHLGDEPEPRDQVMAANLHRADTSPAIQAGVLPFTGQNPDLLPWLAIGLMLSTSGVLLTTKSKRGSM